MYTRSRNLLPRLGGARIARLTQDEWKVSGRVDVASESDAALQILGRKQGRTREKRLVPDTPIVSHSMYYSVKLGRVRDVPGRSE